ncbi:MAG TPA: hypothetical protein VF641_10840 [Methylobacterium sp.]|jgi:hypothetical protein
MPDASALPSLFTGIDARIPRVLTPSMRHALNTLEVARPFGLTRVRGGWRGVAGFVSSKVGVALTHEKLARIDYGGRNPRLKITSKGREALPSTRGDAR